LIKCQIDDIYLFDGHRPRSIATGVVRDWWRNDISRGYEHLCKCLYDEHRKGVWIFYPNGGATANNTAALFWHIPTGKWGYCALDVEAAFTYTEPGVTWASVASTYATWNALSASDLTWASGWWTAGQSSIAIFDTAHTAYSLEDNRGSATLQSHWFGNAFGNTAVSRVFPVCYSLGADQVNMEYKLNSGGSWTTGPSQVKNVFTNQQFEVLQTGRWHRATFSISEDAEMIGFEAEIKPAGER
jgi:hypothetical protein